jgi:type IV pilus assembly protein PilV
MVETLVSVFILALGVIGASAMQLAALRTVQDSAIQTSSLQLARDIADMIRRPGSSSEEVLQAFLALDYSTTENLTDTTSTFCLGAVNACTASELAAHEIQEIKSRMSESHPNARIKVCRDANPWDGGNRQYRWGCSSSGGHETITVKIGWQGKADQAEADQESNKEFPPKVVLLISPAKSAL